MANVYNLERVNVTDATYVSFLRCPLNGSLLKVPGIGKDTLNKLASGNEPIKNTYQLIGKYLSLKNINDTSESHCNKFLNWLKSKGIHLHCDEIVMSIGEKTNTWIPGIYDCDC